MCSHSYDVVVVGAGLSGLMSAWVAQRSGMRVALVANGVGRFAYGAATLMEDGSLNETSPQNQQDAVKAFCEFAQQAGCSYEGRLGQTRLLPGVMGDFHRVLLAPAAMWDAQPENGTLTAVVGIQGLTGFNENFMAERMGTFASALGLNGRYSARRICLERFSSNPVTATQIAHCFDHDAAFRASLAAAIRRAAHGCDRVLMPAVLGIRSNDRGFEQFAREVGGPIAELMLLPPFAPAHRVFHALEDHLNKIGVELYLGFPVKQLNFQRGRCEELLIASPGHALRLRGEHVILATGQKTAKLLGAEFVSGDAAHRPLDRDGNLLADNVHLAGYGAPSGANLHKLISGYNAGCYLVQDEGFHAA